jgi:ribosomal protein S27E
MPFKVTCTECNYPAQFIFENESIFLRCPNCGREREIERTMEQENEKK